MPSQRICIRPSNASYPFGGYHSIQEPKQSSYPEVQNSHMHQTPSTEFAVLLPPMRHDMHRPVSVCIRPNTQPANAAERKPTSL